ncbi:MAG TPA: hypothetical protein PLL06_10510, partial [Acidobacteriota bacterium]|nr:hypothetical protein [Acidobacteriota bacterium]
MQIATLYATVGADTRDFQRNMQTVDGRLRDVKGRFTALERNKITVDTDQAESKLRGLSNLSGVVTTALGTLGGNLLTATISKVTGGVSDIISRGLEMNDVLERARIGFTTMLGSADKANAKIAELQKFAETTPFEFKGLVQNSQLLLGFGFRAEELIPTLT